LIPYYGYVYLLEQHHAVEASRGYLTQVAEVLRADGVNAETHTMVMGDAAFAIDEAARTFHADMIAVATHGRGTVGRLLRGSVAWQALAHSPVPVLIRHVHQDSPMVTAYRPPERRILVPLDGSTLAEKALPLAQELAREGDAEIWLAQIVFTMATAPGKAVQHMGEIPYAEIEPAKREAEAYLDQVAARLGGDVHTRVLLGAPVEDLVAAAQAWLISDIVMASHGRTGLSRVILGSVADALIHRLELPIIGVPALATQPSAEGVASAGPAEKTAVPV
jgi:nucleotide-binding universal stress UspA family protein